LSIDLTSGVTNESLLKIEDKISQFDFELSLSNELSIWRHFKWRHPHLPWLALYQLHHCYVQHLFLFRHIILICHLC